MRLGSQKGRALMIVGLIGAASLPFSSVFASPRTNNTSHDRELVAQGWTPSASMWTRNGTGWNRAATAQKRRGGRHQVRGVRGSVLQCVPFARNASGIALVGNAWTWWQQAAGNYERGRTPEPGSVLAFRPNGTMRLGHVAVVSRLVNGREIEIDHANWGGYPGNVARGISVIDVSSENDWTAVRVELPNGQFGSVYPTHGFIYDRPDRGTLVTAKTGATPQRDLNPAPYDLRPAIEQPNGGGAEEVAEAPPHRHSQRRR